MQTEICDICKAIPFHKLPFEDEPALPHLPSFQALKVSADDCPLCSLILTAANESRKHIDHVHSGDGGGEGEWRQFSSRKLPSGKSVSEVTSFGAYAPGMSFRTGRGPHRTQSTQREPLAGFPFQDDTSVRPWLYGNWWAVDANPKVVSQLVGMGVRVGTGPEIEAAEGNTEDRVWFRGSQLRLRTDDGTAIANTIPGRLRTVDSGSSIAFDRARSWAQMCDVQHRCAPFDAVMPTRVLDLGQLASQSLTLVETRGQRGRYMTLSHCWGTAHKFTTTTANLGTRKQAISLHDLPKTYQDAVSITRQFGVQYLWIDSLCILQDSLLDWERESSKMCDIYSQSYLTISASSSTDDSSGCFPSLTARGAAHLAPELISLGRETIGNTSALVIKSDHFISQRPITFLDVLHDERVSRVHISIEWMPSSRKSDPRLYRIGAFGIPFDPIHHQHLSTRGWTLQERLLSPRVLHYSTDQMYWECTRCFLGEDGSRFDWGRFDLAVVILGERLPNSECGLPQGGGVSLIEGFPIADTERHGRWRGGWLSHIQRYSQQRLSLDRDKLPALSGLASSLAKHTGDRYYAGLWWNHILEDLHWRVYARDELRIQVPGGFEHIYGEKLCDVKVPSSYRAPSWSWASLDARIIFVPLDFQQIMAECLSCQTVPSGNDPFGRVSGGKIYLRAPLIEIHRADPNYKPDKLLPLGFGILTSIDLPHGVSHGNAFFDTEPQFPCFALFLDSSNSLILKEKATTPAVAAKTARFRFSKPFKLFPNSGEKHSVGKEAAGNEMATPAQEFVRVGIANFLRTEHQRKSPQVGVQSPYGPITAQDERTLVTIF